MQKLREAVSLEGFVEQTLEIRVRRGAQVHVFGVREKVSSQAGAHVPLEEVPLNPGFSREKKDSSFLPFFLSFFFFSIAFNNILVKLISPSITLWLKLLLTTSKTSKLADLSPVLRRPIGCEI